MRKILLVILSLSLLLGLVACGEDAKQSASENGENKKVESSSETPSESTSEVDDKKAEEKSEAASESESEESKESKASEEEKKDTPTDKNAQIKEAIELYKQLALCFETDYDTALIKRWPKVEIKIAVAKDLNPKYRKALEEVAKEMSEISENYEGPNFVIVEEDPESALHKYHYNSFFIGSPDELKKKLELDKFDIYNWFINWETEPNFQFTDGQIYISDALDDDKIKFAVAQCLHAQMGLFNPDVKEEKIALKHNSKQVELTDLDKLLLEMHYRPELRTGMPVKDAVKSLEDIYLNGVDPKEVKERNTQTKEEWLAEKAKLNDTDTKTTDEIWESFGVKPRHANVVKQDFYAERKKIDSQFFEKALKYFEEVCMHTEWDPNHDGFLKKWEQDEIVVSISGDYEDWDLETLKRMLDQLNNIPNLPKFSLKEEKDLDADMVIQMGPLREIHDAIGSDMYSEWGLFSYFWDPEDIYKIHHADIIIATDVNSLNSRRHLLQEEFIQALGLVNDSYKYSDSIFQQSWTTVAYPNEMDWLLVEMLYRPELKPNMKTEEVLKTLREVYLDGE